MLPEAEMLSLFEFLIVCDDRGLVLRESLRGSLPRRDGPAASRPIDCSVVSWFPIVFNLCFAGLRVLGRFALVLVGCVSCGEYKSNGKIKRALAFCPLKFYHRQAKRKNCVIGFKRSLADTL